MATLPPEMMGSEGMVPPGEEAAVVAPAGPASTNPQALIEQILALASDDQQQLAVRQQLEQQQLADGQKNAMMQALQAIMQGLGGAAHVPGGAEAAVPPAEDYAGVAPELPMEALAQLPQGGAPVAPGLPVLQPDEIPPQFG